MPARCESIAKAVSATETGPSYSPAELKFLRAVEDYKRRNRVRFPTAVDLLRLACEMGYRLSDESAAAGGAA